MNAMVYCPVWYEGNGVYSNTPTDFVTIKIYSMLLSPDSAKSINKFSALNNTDSDINYQP